MPIPQGPGADFQPPPKGEEWFLVLDAQKGFYWRPRSCGYGYLYQAGLYTQRYAVSLEASSRSEAELGPGGRMDRAIPLVDKLDELREIRDNCIRLIQAAEGERRPVNNRFLRACRSGPVDATPCRCWRCNRSGAFRAWWDRIWRRKGGRDAHT